MMMMMMDPCLEMLGQQQVMGKGKSASILVCFAGLPTEELGSDGSMQNKLERGHPREEKMMVSLVTTNGVGRGSELIEDRNE